MLVGHLTSNLQFLKYAYYFAITASVLRLSFSDIIAKSRITLCENTGQGEDPYNVVMGKNCEKKMIVSMSVYGGQNGTEMLKATVANVSKVYDTVEREEARLYNPFVVSLVKTKVKLIYPYFLVGTVNNKPREQKIFSTSGVWHAGSYHLCNDMYYSDDTTCGFQRDADGKKIWDSQGFCCFCTESEKHRGTLNMDQPFIRGGIKCKVFSSSQAAAFCMVRDDLWYNVHEVGQWQKDFKIHVKAYDQVTTRVGNKTNIKWVDGGEIVIGPSKTRGVGKHGRLVASFVGEFQNLKQHPSLQGEYLLIPRVEDAASLDPQQTGGPETYLLVPKHEVILDELKGPHICDRIGVTYTAWRNQAVDGRGYGCRQKSGSCLHNQPKDYFDEDMERLRARLKPRYFPTKYGKLVGVERSPQDHNQFFLAYETDEMVASLVTLQISADDIILIYNRATGKILKAYANDFEALSAEGFLSVEIQNTGYVTADFYVTVSECSGGIGTMLEKAASVNPQATHIFVFKVHAFKYGGGKNYCLVQLFDSRRKLIDSANVTFTTYEPCVCITGCTCTCSASGYRCGERDKRDFDQGEGEDDGADMGIVGDTWKKVKNFVNMVKKLLQNITGIQALIASLIGLLTLGAIKALLGLRRGRIARMGLGGKSKGQTKKKDKNGRIIIVEHNEKGDEINAETKEVIKKRSKAKDFCCNIFFFLFLPCIVVQKLFGWIFAPSVRADDAEQPEKMDFNKKKQMFENGDSPSDVSSNKQNRRLSAKSASNLAKAKFGNQELGVAGKEHEPEKKSK